MWYSVCGGNEDVARPCASPGSLRSRWELGRQGRALLRAGVATITLGAGSTGSCASPGRGRYDHVGVLILNVGVLILKQKHDQFLHLPYFLTFWYNNNNKMPFPLYRVWLTHGSVGGEGDLCFGIT